jgi:hypothetical protein
VSLADRMAIVSPHVSALAVEASEFPELSRRFSVQGVPRTVVNRGGSFVGALPEMQFVSAVLDLAGVEANGHLEGDISAESEERSELGSDLKPKHEPDVR